MEMESAESDHASGCIKETAVEDLFGLGSSPYACDFEGELPMIPISARVGDEYQVEIPVTNPADSQSANDSNPFLVGLPIPITWVKEMNDITAEELEFPTTDQVNKIEAEGLDKPDDLVIGEESEAPDLRTVFPKEKDSNQIPRRSCYFSKQRSKSCFPVPDSSYKEIWSDAEVDSFLLGLYIFRKNFKQLQRFMEHKNVGEIQSFYYQRFYGSDEYHRWSDCHKNRNKRCIIGEKLFIGWRQQELISRMIPHLPEEAQKTLSEVKSFQKDSSLEEYVFSLKATVGLHVLVKAVGIGKGKEDLTGFPTEPGKNNQEHPVDRAPKMPKGKDFASLSFTEIVNILTGGVRLSKTRSNEIFWEAVWPRLLANGWHSEQPKNLGYLRSEDYLVFLMPGIKKYLKRKLTKGDHYYDSVSDVLKKVQSEPKLIQLGAEEDPVGCCNEEGRWVPEVTSDQEDVSDHQRTRYLKPRVVTSNSDHMKNSNHTKFTVVDTSLPRGGKACGIVELRYPPVECKTNLKQTDFSSDSEEESSDSEISEYRNDVAEGAGVPLKSKKNKAKHCKGNSGALRKFTVVDTSLVFGGKLSIVRELRCSPDVDKRVPKAKRVLCENGAISSETLLRKKKPGATDIVLDGEENNFSVNCREDTPGSAEKMERHQDQKTCMTDTKQPNMSQLSTFHRRAKSNHSNTKGPPMKRRRLTSCAKAETSSNENCLQGLQSEQVGLHGTLNNLESGELIVALVGPQQKVSSSTAQEESCSNTSQAQAPSNLNAPQDLVTCIEVSRETNTESSGIPSGGTDLVDEASRTSKTRPRKSTRVRPPTTKALEALANGFLCIKPRQKRKRENSSPHPSRKPRKVQNRDRATSSHADAVGEIVTPIEEMEVDEACNVNQGTVNKPLDQNGEKLLTSY